MWGIRYRPMAVYCPRVPRPYRQITPFSLYCRPQAHSVLWLQFSSWRGYIRFLLWRPGWAHQSKSGLVFRCCPSLHCATFGAADLRGSFNRAEHCVAVSIIPPVTFSLFSPFYFFPLLCCLAVWAGRFRGERPRFYPPLDAALLIRENNKDDLVLYMYGYTRVVIVFFVLIGIKRWPGDESHVQNLVLRGRTFQVGGGRGVIGDFRNKISGRMISREKNSCKEKPGEKNFLHWKNIYFMAYNPRKKVLHRLLSGKKFIIRGLKKKYSYPNQITPTPP